MGKAVFVRSGVLSPKYASMRRSLLSQCMQAGVALESASSKLDFLLENDQSGDVRFTPCNMFTLLAALGNFRDPNVLQHLIHRETYPVTGAWKETFIDERGTWILTHTPPNSWGCTLLPNPVPADAPVPATLHPVRPGSGLN